MKSFLRFAFLALVLLLVALVSALTAMRFAIHGREVVVPDLIGKTPADARRIVEADGCDFQVERQFYSATVPEGKILSQVPNAGMRIRRGWQIRVAESLGPQRVAVPNVVGESERAAEFNIRRRGLDLGSVAQLELPAATPDQVIAQSPAPNATQMSAPKISLLLGETAPPRAFLMPSFVGQSLGNATAALQTAGLKLGQVSVVPPPASPLLVGPLPAPPAPPQPTPASIIVSQSPLAGGKLLAGGSVSFQVK